MASTECVLKGSDWFSIKNLVCGDLKGIDWCQEPDKCTIIGANIANSMVKVAATRIFKDPAQCLVEIIVNSLDSYNQLLGKPKTGRFGMGFFSLLYHLVGKPNNSLIVNTKCKDSPEYRLEIREINSELKFQLKPVDEFFSNIVSGTRVELSHSMLFQDFSKYVNYFLDVSRNAGGDLNKKIVFNYRDYSFFVSHDLQSGQISQNSYGYLPWNGGVKVEMSGGKVVVDDRAGGISLDVILNSLLIPSVSTKTLALSKKVQSYQNFSYFEETSSNEIYKHYLAIIINHVHLVHLPIEAPFSIGIYLPSTVTVPVTRDDIILDPLAQKEFMISINMILDKILKNKISRPVYVLENALNTYSLFTNNEDNRHFINICLEKIYQKIRQTGELLVSKTDEKIYQLLEIPSVTVLNTDSFEIEARLNNVNLKELIDDKVFAGKNIVKMPPAYDGPVTNGGSISYIFVPALIHQKENWIQELSYQYGSELISNEDPIFKQFLREYEGYFKDNPEYKAVLTRIYNRVKLVYYYMTSAPPEKFEQFIEILDHEISFFTVSFDGEDLTSLLNKYVQRLDRIHLEMSYGNKKPILFKWNTDCNKNIKMTLENYHIFYRYFDYLLTVPNENPEILIFGVINNEYSIESFYKNNFELCKDTEFKYLYLVIHFINYLQTVKFISDDKKLQIEPFMEAYNFLSKNGPLFILKIKDVFRSYLQQIAGQSLFKIRDSINLTNAISELTRWLFYVKDHDTRLPVVNFDFSSQGVNFTTKQLIAHVFKDDLDNLIDDQLKIVKNPLNFKLQTVEIATNSGTTKAFINAVITELVQNSLDAIRSANKGGNQVKNKVEIQLTRDSQGHLQVTIADLVGMDLKNMVSLIIPFYSTKVASKDVTGEMGTGFFNIYRETSAVKIETIKDHSKIILNALPIRDSDFLVTDILNNLTTSPTHQPNGTAITFVINNQSFNEYVHQVSTIANYIDDAVKFMDINLIFNNNDVIGEKNLVTEFASGIRIYFTRTQTFRPLSHIFTKGVPFVPLVEFINNTEELSSVNKEFLDFLNTGFILDLPHGFYQPIQSRNKLYISPQNIPALKEAVIFLLFAAIVLEVKMADDIKSPIGPVSNFYSQTSLEQVMPEISEIQLLSYHSTIFWNYPLNDGSKIVKMSSIVKEYSLHHNNKSFTEFFSMPKQWSVDGSKLNIYEIYYNLVVKFVSTKKLTNAEAKIIRIENSPIFDMVKVMAEIFYDTVKEKAKIAKLDYPNFAVAMNTSYSSDDEHTRAQYYKNTMEIFAHQLVNYEQAIISLFTNPTDENFRSNKFAIDYLVFHQEKGQLKGGAASTLIHELEHAWRNKNAGPASHADMEIDGKLYDFNGSALYHFELINRLGIYPEFLKRLGSIRPESVKKENKMQQVENNHKDDRKDNTKVVIFEKSLVEEFNFGQFLANNEVNYFVKPYGIFRTNNRYVVIMDLVNGKEVTSYVRNDNKVDFSIAVIMQLVDAITKMHKCGIYHRDLKPHNVMVEETQGKVKVKIIDYGLVCGNNLTLCEDGFRGGTPYYYVPEYLHTGATRKFVDYWPMVLMILFLMDRKFYQEFVRIAYNDGKKSESMEPYPLFNFLLTHLGVMFKQTPMSLENLRQEKISEWVENIAKKFYNTFYASLVKHLCAFFLDYCKLYCEYDIVRTIARSTLDKELLAKVKNNPDYVDDSGKKWTIEQLENLITKHEQDLKEAKNMFVNFNRSDLPGFSLEKMREELAGTMEDMTGSEFKINDGDCKTPVKLIDRILHVDDPSDIFTCTEEILGRGGFGEVKKCRLTDDGREVFDRDAPSDKKYAIKFIDKKF